jgi:hypothetical protein
MLFVPTQGLPRSRDGSQTPIYPKSILVMRYFAALEHRKRIGAALELWDALVEEAVNVGLAAAFGVEVVAPGSFGGVPEHIHGLAAGDAGGVLAK